MILIIFFFFFLIDIHSDKHVSAGELLRYYSNNFSSPKMYSISYFKNNFTDKYNINDGHIRI
jgi:hypothetical protein